MTRLEMKIRGKSPEEQYKLLRWLFYDYGNRFTNSPVAIIEWLSQEVDDVDLDEWCYECKEYDQEKHHCPRFNKIIRQTIAEIQRSD